MDAREQVLGQRHPWELSRFEFLRDVVSGLSLCGTTVLDAGSGDSWLARQLVNDPVVQSVTCWDLAYAESMPAGSERLCMTAQRPQEAFDLVLALDVLEHVEDPDPWLRVLVRENLKPGGWLLVTVPAWNVLFSSHDVALEHYRRYSPSELCGTLRRAGLEVVRGGGLFHVAGIVRALQVVIERLRPRGFGGIQRKTFRPWPATAHTLGMTLLKTEAKLSRLASNRGVWIPGLSLWAICRAPERA